MYSVEELKKDLKELLSDFRYNHSLLVADCAKNLAIYYNLDSDKAYITGLVHDISKEFDNDKNKYYVDKYNIDNKYLDELKPVLHSLVGAYYIKEKYDMDDEICNAVKYHTLGNINMTLFDKIILVSDKLGRENKDLELEKIAYENIDKALLVILKRQKDKLSKIGKEIHPDTKELLKNIENML